MKAWIAFKMILSVALERPLVSLKLADVHAHTLVFSRAYTVILNYISYNAHTECTDRISALFHNICRKLRKRGLRLYDDLGLGEAANAR